MSIVIDRWRCIRLKIVYTILEVSMCVELSGWDAGSDFYFLVDSKFIFKKHMRVGIPDLIWALWATFNCRLFKECAN